MDRFYIAETIGFMLPILNDPIGKEFYWDQLFEQEQIYIRITTTPRFSTFTNWLHKLFNK